MADGEWLMAEHLDEPGPWALPGPLAVSHQPLAVAALAAFFFVLSAVLIVLGMFLEPPAIIFGFLPTFMPLLMQANIDLIHWGVLIAINMGLGCIVPPVALNLFVSTQLAGVQYAQAVRAAIPFMVIMAIDLAIVAVYPTIALLLPHLLFGYPIR